MTAKKAKLKENAEKCNAIYHSRILSSFYITTATKLLGESKNYFIKKLAFFSPQEIIPVK
jgi:hypothetical protein